ncbi:MULTISPECIES: UDP-N-acetylglucosamine 2-epimerase [Paenibacillus]|uniref:UDP-N-acetylglucosamine 2-epimerase (Non-hydrolysing)/GDP/UDP-N,N'-diacetylbacillosamine 2-epimerase (Hydrolysing) n=1 Tax=Paenibacillus pabuli TaxID=1472 RepID=A0A855Y974_9BACL|nr:MULTISPECIES: UDP-N-acetylglucosamine 2-epimerase [Paenibacillus]PWW37445.1 UDP-N-acetylglucosamine 2-epimerase (non-hydrolysing)/GDP/UDP-N,N'-diacetylbacillosamine 2-epimerase (hydrolysing) [Paenibacillus pabuli]PXW05587.1 UDP-N-acetylglucosamine 2-epimerase (non-hydrolysing)/GDP/UDP-N,N'-diacetylbacillosamine 2-epimerase (hydrolysing) [Paenibacillus taichungensis]RAI98877.1 UDP-N-acetylglucosamine 2-epimerase (non-hydrolysing)/GDP/UDP-N,N'-diacetylbacillosamine 2-epimerase (hydrolysing) [Pa
MSKRKVCIVTGTRAEYGLLSSLMREIKHDDELELQIIVTGMHLSPEFGLTYKEIEKDNFFIDEKIEMLLSSDTPSSIVKSMGIATIGFADAFQRLQPDILVLLGDRFEILSAAQAALVMKIPIAHISGGELTEGAIDDSIRHSITKMSHIHFTATEDYARRVIQLGEQPNMVLNVGDLGVGNIRDMELLSIEELSEFYGFNPEKSLLITFHPATLENDMSKLQMENLLSAIDHFPEYKVILTKSNADTDGRIINDLIDEYAVKYPDRVKSFVSLGQLRYLSTMKHCAVVIGNSSSGIIEAPVFLKPTVNIGDRQKGRLKANSVIDCDPITEDIINSVEVALSQEFQGTLSKMNLKYDGRAVSLTIKDYLKKINLNNIVKKRFYDLV